MPLSCAAASASAIGDGDLQDAIARQATLGNQPIERLPSTSSIVRKWTPSALLDRMDRDDVRVVERRDGAGLSLKAREPIRIAGQIGRQDLERDIAAEPRIAGAIHLAHPAGAQQRDDFKRTEAGPRRECHREGLESATAPHVVW